MLTLATLGMFGYGAYSITWGIVAMLKGLPIEWWAELGVSVFGALLALSAAFVRVRLPGGLAFAIGAMLALRALEVHNAAHFETGLGPQIGRAIFAAVMVGLAVAGARRPSRPRV